MHQHFWAVLEKFPFSSQLPQAYLRITAVDETEPALHEQVFHLATQKQDLHEVMQGWAATDSCFEVEGYWDLWRLEEEGQSSGTDSSSLPRRLRHLVISKTGTAGKRL